MDVVLPVAQGMGTQPSQPGGIGGQWKTPQSARIGSSLGIKVEKIREIFQHIFVWPVFVSLLEGKKGGL